MATETTTPSESTMNEVGHSALLSVGVSSIVDQSFYHSFWLSTLNFTWAMEANLVLV
jgi:hypothetical protein